MGALAQAMEGALLVFLLACLHLRMQQKREREVRLVTETKIMIDMTKLGEA
jgi:hypothetical protein